MKTMTVELTEGNVRYILHALRELKQKCQLVVNDDDADEDEQFFYANDLMETKLALEEIEKIAVETFGKGILEFSHETL